VEVSDVDAGTVGPYGEAQVGERAEVVCSVQAEGGGDESGHAGRRRPVEGVATVEPGQGSPRLEGTGQA
jgi:hypothetical protein